MDKGESSVLSILMSTLQNWSVLIIFLVHLVFNLPVGQITLHHDVMDGLDVFVATTSHLLENKNNITLSIYTLFRMSIKS